MSDDSNGPLHQYKRMGFRLEVWPNRIEVQEGTLPISKKKHSIPMRNVSSVSVEGKTRKLHIRTYDGEDWEFNVGGDAQKVRDTIMEQV